MHKSTNVVMLKIEFRQTRANNSRGQVDNPYRGSSNGLLFINYILGGRVILNRCINSSLCVQENQLMYT